MPSVPVRKDVGEYQPKVVGKMTARSLACTVAAVAAAAGVGAYSWFVLGLSTDVSQYTIFAVALPIWAAGFWRPLGMPPEQFVPLWLAHRLSDNKVMLSSPAPGAPPARGRSKAYARLCRTRGVEAAEFSKEVPEGEEADRG